MKKRLLKEVNIEDANDELIELAKNMIIPYEDKYLQVMFFSAKEIIIEKNKILLLHLYPQSDLKEENAKAAYRIFLNQDDYTTQELNDANKWITASVRHILSQWSWRKSGRLKNIISDDESEQVVKRYLKAAGNPIKIIIDHQDSIMAQRLAKKHKNTIDRIDLEMEKVTNLPGDFDDWVDETALYGSRYIYYEYKAGRKKLEGYCTHCKRDLSVEGARHNKQGICPNCKSPITFKAIGKSRNIKDVVAAALLQKTEDGFIVRHIRVNKDYRGSYRNPKINYIELERHFYTNDEIRSYEHTEFKQSGKDRWCDYSGIYDFSKVAVYEATINESIKGTKYQYSALRELATNTQGFMFNVNRYLGYYKEYRFIEYLVKLKLYALTIDLINSYGSSRVDLNGKSMLDILKISKASIPILQANNSNIDELRLVQVMEEMNLKLSAEQIKYINTEFGCATSLIEMGEYTTINKAIKYIISKNDKGNKLDVIYSNWMDYIRFCKELEYNLKNEFVLYPRNLTQEHDRLIELILAKKNKAKEEKLKEQNIKIEAMAKELNEKYKMVHKQLIIQAPNNTNEIILEGQTLHHCVGTYISKIAEGNSIILFIRKEDKPSKPYCTLEIVDGKITQCRGKNNKDMRDKLKILLNRFESLKLAMKIEREAM